MTNNYIGHEGELGYGRPFVTYKGRRPDGTKLYIHTATGVDVPTKVAVVKNGIWKESKYCYYDSSDAIDAVNNVWDDVKWQKVKPIDVIKDIILSGEVYEDNWQANIVANYFEETFDLEEAGESLNFQMDEKWYTVEFGDCRMDEQMADLYGTPEKYGYWLFAKQDGEELSELRWEH